MSRRNPTRRPHRLPRRRTSLGAPGAGILSPDQIANYAAAAGFTGDDLITAVAIALAESDPPGNPNSHNTQGEDSRGLWQINVAAHPDLASYDLYDPAVNAQVAYRFYLTHNFYPWTTWTSGKYQRYLAAAQQGVLDDARGVQTVSSDLPVATSVDGFAPIAQPDNNFPLVLGVVALTIYGVGKVLDWLE